MASIPILMNNTHVVEITIGRNWTEVCHHVKAYLAMFCKPIHAQCTALYVGHVPCRRNVCICLHRSDETSTVVRARVTHSGDFNQSWPPWVENVEVIGTENSPLSNVVNLAFVCITLTFFTVAAFVLFVAIAKLLKRYFGYKKVETQAEAQTETPVS